VDAAAGKLWLRTLLALGYTCGFRKAELLDTCCKQVDLLNNSVCLYSGETKNGEGRTVTLTEECRMLVTELHREKHPEVFLITRPNGESVKDFRETWEVLVSAAGVPGFLLHDAPLCCAEHGAPRSSEKTAREISGHKTDAVFSRYNIVSEADIRDAAHKIEEGAKAAVWA
jgi:integrase